MAVACDNLDITYPRLKKACHLNSFSQLDLELLLPGKSIEALRDEFQFTLARRNSSPGARGPGSFELYSTIEEGFRAFQRGVRGIDFEQFVEGLYEKLGSRASPNAMMLFCSQGALPIEWTNEFAQRQLANALKEGAFVLYVMETDLYSPIVPEDVPSQDDTDRVFSRFLDNLTEEWDDKANEDSVVALIRVRKCEFCTPYQKQTLFSIISDGIVRNYALTTVDVPERLNGEGSLGTAVLPLREEVALSMRRYVIALIRYLKKFKTGGAPDPANFRYEALYGLNKRDEGSGKIVECLAHIMGYQL